MADEFDGYDETTLKEMVSTKLSGLVDCTAESTLTLRLYPPRAS